MTPPEAVMSHVSPLTKVSTTGELYTRRPEVEAQLQDLARSGFAFDLNALNNRDRDSDGYLYDETLVYLIRFTRDTGDEGTLNTLYIELDRRAGLLLRKFERTLFKSDPSSFDDFKQNIAMALLRKILDTGSDAGDYAQVNFGDYLLAVANDTGRTVIRRLRTQPTLFDDMRPWADDGQAYEDTIVRPGSSIDDILAVRQAIATLPEKLRLAATMCYLDGWQIDSNSPSVGTISGYFDVSEKTVRNWLKEARRLLAEQGWNG